MELTSLIEARPTKRGEVRAWSRQVLDLADRDGMSTADLAARLGCSHQTVYSWRRRLRKQQAAKQASATPQLVRVQVARPTAAQSIDRLEIRVGSGRSILVPASFEPAALAAVVDVLERC